VRVQLLALARDTHAQVRAGAVAGLGALAKPGDDEALALLEHALEDEDAGVRSAAIEVLGAHGRAPVPAPGQLPDDPAEAAALAHVLGHAGGERARDELLALLAAGGAPARDAAVALGRLGDPAAVAPLEAAIAEESGAAALEAVGALAALRTSSPLRAQGLKNALVHPDARVREVAARNAPRSALPVLEALAQDFDARVRRAAARTLDVLRKSDIQP
jgi:HEAT repeat protein